MTTIPDLALTGAGQLMATPMTSAPAGSPSDRIQAVVDDLAAALTVARDALHPRKADGTFMAHCHVCATYIDDDLAEPPVDLLCDECQEEGEDLPGVVDDHRPDDDDLEHDVVRTDCDVCFGPVDADGDTTRECGYGPDQCPECGGCICDGAC